MIGLDWIKYDGFRNLAPWKLDVQLRGGKIDACIVYPIRTSDIWIWQFHLNLSKTYPDQDPNTSLICCPYVLYHTHCPSACQSFQNHTSRFTNDKVTSLLPKIYPSLSLQSPTTSINLQDNISSLTTTFTTFITVF